MKIISDLDVIGKKLGFDPVTTLLIPNILLDAQKMATPMVAEVDGREWLVAREQELGNLRAQGVPLSDLALFDPYVTLSDGPKPVADVGTFADLIRRLAGSGEVQVEADLPYARFLQLPPELTITVAESENVSARVVVHELDQDEVLGRFAGWRGLSKAAALRVIEGVPQLSGIVEELNDEIPDTRFTGLRALAESQGLAAILSAAKPNYTELTACAPGDDSFALWLADGERILVLSSSTSAVPGRFVGEYDSLGEAIVALVPEGKVGIEEEWLGVAVAQRLAESIELVPVSKALASWRDVRDNEDLGSQIVVAQTSCTSIEGALEWAREELRNAREFTERDIYERYLVLVQQFGEQFSLPFEMKPYFVNLHAADRTLYPGPPTDHLINADTLSVKFDAGLAVTVDGVILATSDMARSLLTTPAGQEAYEIFHSIVRSDIIGNLNGGKVCEDIHQLAVEAVLAKKERLIELGLLSEATDFAAEYNKRNVGHLMGKQESFVTELRPGHLYELPVGAIGAAEIQWSFGKFSIGIEDMWFIGRTGTFITTIGVDGPGAGR